MAAKSDNKKAFAKHKTNQNNDTSSSTSQNSTTKMSIFARILIFIFIPSITGLSGLGISYLLSLKTPQEDEEQHIVDFDRDFVTPFLLALAFVIVLGFQTNGFNPQSAAKRKGVFVWPSTRRKVRRERIVVDDDDNANADKKEQ